MGDFNTCLLKDDNRSKQLLSIVDSCNVKILPLSPTHNLPNCTASLLDLIMVSSTDFISKHGQCSADAFSYHDLIYLSYKLRAPKRKPNILLRRNFGGMDSNGLRSDALATDWSRVIEASSVDNKVEIFNSLTTKLYDIYAPLRLIKMKHLPAPWLNDDLKHRIEKKNIAKAKFKSDNSEDNRSKYIMLRNRCNRDAQRRHVHKEVENGDTSRVWKFLRTLGVGKPSHDTLTSKVDVEQLNLSFTSLNSFYSNDKLRTLNSIAALPTPNFPFTFSQFTECDVKNVLREYVLCVD